MGISPLCAQIPSEKLKDNIIKNPFSISSEVSKETLLKRQELKKKVDVITSSGAWDFNVDIDKVVIDKAIDKIRKLTMWEINPYEPNNEFEILFCIYISNDAKKCSDSLKSFGVPGSFQQIILEFNYLKELFELSVDMKEKISKKLKAHYNSELDEKINGYMEKPHILIPILCGDYPKDFPDIAINIMFSEVKTFLFGEMN